MHLQPSGRLLLLGQIAGLLVLLLHPLPAGVVDDVLAHARGLDQRLEGPAVEATALMSLAAGDQVERQERAGEQELRHQHHDHQQQGDVLVGRAGADRQAHQVAAQRAQEERDEHADSWPSPSGLLRRAKTSEEEQQARSPDRAES